MKTKDIELTDVEVIAQFMGLDVDGNKVTDGHIETTLDKLKYNTSWDWLMPVWVKFRELVLLNNTDWNKEVLENYKDEIGYTILNKPDPKYSVEIIARGIRWYNSVKDKTEQ